MLRRSSPLLVGAIVLAFVVPTAAARAPARQLQPAGVERAHGVQFHRYQQRVDGYPVLGGQTVVTDAPGTRGDLVVDHSRAGIATPPRPGVSRAQAVRIARGATGVRTLRAATRAELAILPRPAAGRLVWRVLLPARVPLGSFEVLVDAVSGAVVGSRDLLQHATGSAQLFDPNPVDRQGSASGLSDNNDADSPALTSLRTPVTLPRLSDADNCLDGQFVRALVGSSDVCTPGRNFDSVTRSADAFEALMSYFHIDRAQAYIQSLGFTNANNRQVVVHADDIPDDNSFYDPTTREITFGAGGVDDAEDGDVVVHEYGHSVQDDQVPGFGQSDDGGAMGEGFGDYLEAAMAAQFSPDHAFDACFAEWDTVGVGDPSLNGCLRRLDTGKTLSQARNDPNCASDIHCVGEVWSDALWTIRGRIGGPTADKIVIQSHFSLTPNASFEDGSRALVAADRQLNAGANRAVLVDVLAAHELVDPERLDDTPGEAAPLAVPGTASSLIGPNRDPEDIYAFTLAAGHGVILRLTGGPTVSLRVLRPGTTSVNQAGAVLAAAPPGPAPSLGFVAPADGTYFLEVAAVSGDGSYSLDAASDSDGDGLADGADDCPAVANADQADRDRDGVGDACDRFPDDPANDADGDGIGANADNCPTVANRDQRDFNRNKRGDACDRASRATLRRGKLSRRRLTLSGTLEPRSLPASAWHLQVSKRVCRAGRCRFSSAREVKGAKRSGRRIVRRLRLRTGRYRIRAVVRARGKRATRSKAIFVTIR